MSFLFKKKQFLNSMKIFLETLNKWMKCVSISKHVHLKIWPSHCDIPLSDIMEINL